LPNYACKARRGPRHRKAAALPAGRARNQACAKRIVMRRYASAASSAAAAISSTSGRFIIVVIIKLYNDR